MANMLNKINNLQKRIVLIYIAIFLLSINSIYCRECKDVKNLLDQNCFNDVITFNHSYWRSGHACATEKGEVIVEFSTNPGISKKRLFYGLNNEGRYYFPGEPVYKEIDDIKCEDCSNNDYRGRFESRNLLVYLSGDTNRLKPYMFSMSSYYSVVELIDIEDKTNFKYFTWDVTKFFGISRPIFSFEYSLFEIGNKREYITAYIESAGFKKDSNNVDKEYSQTVNMTRFKFKNFAGSNHREIINIVNHEKTYNGRVVSAFRLDDSQLIVLLFVHYVKEGDQEKINYDAYFYNDSLAYKGKNTIYGGVQNLWTGYGIFVKGITVKGNYAAFAFFSDGKNQKSLSFKFVKYKPDYNFDYYFIEDFNSEDFRPDIQSNGLYRLTDDRVVLFTTQDYNSVEYGSLVMFLFDFYYDYKKLKIRRYRLYYPGKRFAKEMDAIIYNNYTLFTATLSNDHQNQTFAILMLFGFANGTDHEIDISPYLMDTGYYDESKNLYDYLMSTLSIDDNIFGYKKIEKIRLISICDELLLYKGKGSNRAGTVLPLNELFDADHTLFQNKAITKEENRKYTLKYQFMVEEPDYDTFYSKPNNVINKTKINCNENPDPKNNYRSKTFNGRVNILYFKLCHKFCENCIEYGRTDNNNDQRCKTCKSENTYDYLANVNRFTGNCVPSGYMYDAENKTLKTCNSDNYKYYFNISESKKKYCFMYKYPCPDDYHYLNETSHECLDYTPPAPTTIATTLPAPVITEKPTEKLTTIITDKPTTIVTDKPTTIITDKPTTIVTDKPTTIITDKPTTIVTDKPTTIITDKPTTIVTDKPTTIVTEKPSTMITESPAKKPSTIIVENTTENPKETLAPSTIIEDKCIDGSLLNNTCRNLTNQDLYEGIKEEVLSRFPPNGKSVILPGKQGYNFQVTTAKNEIISANSPSSETLIDLGDCEKKLREANGITGNLSLIIYKFYKEGEIVRENDMQFEVYDPYTHKQLNLSVCNSTILHKLS